MNPTPNLAKLLLASALAFALATPHAIAQTPPATQTDPCRNQSELVTTKTFYLTNVRQRNDAAEIMVAIRNLLCPGVKILLVDSQNALVMRAPADELALAEKLISELDRPRKAYRLTYTITELDAGKTVSTQHYSMVVVEGQHTTMKEGDKIPVATGSYSTGNSTAQTQFTYLDVGMNFDVTLDEFASGVRLQSKVEQSSIGPSNTIAGVQEPVVRQTVLQGTSFLSPGKPVMLGSIDTPNSTHHFDIAAVLDPIK